MRRREVFGLIGGIISGLVGFFCGREKTSLPRPISRNESISQIGEAATVSYWQKSISTGLWDHIVGVMSIKENKVRWYMNGERFLDDDGYLLGEIDELTVFRAALSDEQIKRLYDDGR